MAIFNALGVAVLITQDRKQMASNLWMARRALRRHCYKLYIHNGWPAFSKACALYMEGNKVAEDLWKKRDL